ncbi:zinc-binding protein [bacterium]|nr:zinc-binding protein [bacterium]
MSDQEKCACCAAPKLIFACSGGADVGAVSDQAARKMTLKGVGKMFCLAGIGGKISGILKTTEAAASVLVIDGCPIDCAKSSMEQAGFKDFTHLRVTDLGFEKGKTAIDDETISRVVQAGADRLKP